LRTLFPQNGTLNTKVFVVYLLTISANQPT